MKLEKYIQEVDTLQTYFQYFCQHNHTNQVIQNNSHSYKNNDFDETLKLCDECFETLKYSLERLQNCQYEEKPRCRTCKTPCYEKSYWKKLAKVMVYSSLRLKLSSFIDKLKIS